MTEQATIDLVIEAATEAAHNANATLFRSLGVSPSDAPFWHDEQDSAKALKLEVTKDVLGLPNKLVVGDNVNIGNVGLYVGIIRAFPACYGLGVFVDLPQPVFTPAPEPVTVDETTSEAQTGQTIEGTATEVAEASAFSPDRTDAADELLFQPPANQDTNDAAGQPAGTNGQ